MDKKIKGFTLVELLVVIAVIGILATLITAGFSVIQSDTRDSLRSSRMTVLAAALEKYFDANGEYPSCSAMTQPSSTVTTTTFPGLDPLTLATPSATSGVNSITCSCLTQLSGGTNPATCTGGTVGTDSYAYVGDGTTTCATGAYCTKYYLQYKQQSGGAIVTLNSRHS